MAKILLMILMVLVLFLGAYTFFDLINSLWLVLKYEQLTIYSTGALLGKVAFFACTLAAFFLFFRLFKRQR